MSHKLVYHLLFGAAALSLAACGGGGSGRSHLITTPSPPPTPPPPPPPPTSGAPFGVNSDTQFPTVGDDIQVRWDSSAQAYEVRLPEKEWQRLRLGYSSARAEEHYPQDSGYGVRLPKDLPYKYTNLATVFENAWGMPIGQFAFGVPTASDDVPTTGSGSYDAQIWGTGMTPKLSPGQEYEVRGAARLNFDFGKGSLSGYMQPTLTGPNGTFTAPQYTFAQTVFSVGSTTFSGAFIVPGSSAESLFRGLFTGPQAAELMAKWQAPFLDSTAKDPSVWGTMSGVWIGKKGE